MSTGRPYQFTLLLQVSKKSLWSLILYIFFHDLIHVYSPGAGTESPQGTKFWCQQVGIITLPICCKFQRNLSKVWFYTFFFQDFIHVYSPGGRSIQPPGDKVLMSTETSCHFGHMLHSMMHTKIQGHWPFGSTEEDLFRFLPYIWPWRPSSSCDQDHLSKLSFPNPKEAPY